MPFALREMTKAGVPAVAALHVATFNETHTVNNDGPSYELRESQWHKAFTGSDSSWFGIVIENERGELAGFAKGRSHDGGVPGFQGELNKIYLLRRYRQNRKPHSFHSTQHSERLQAFLHKYTCHRPHPAQNLYASIFLASPAHEQPIGTSRLKQKKPAPKDDSGAGQIPRPESR